MMPSPINPLPDGTNAGRSSRAAPRLTIAGVIRLAADPFLQFVGARRINRQIRADGGRSARSPIPRWPASDLPRSEAVPMVSKAQIMALAAGDACSSTGANMLVFGPPGGGSRLAAGHRPRARRERLAGAVPRTSDLVQRLQAARRELAPRSRPQPPRPLRPAGPRRPGLRQEGPGRNERAVRADRRPLRAAQPADHRQPALSATGTTSSRSRP